MFIYTQWGEDNLVWIYTKGNLFKAIEFQILHKFLFIFRQIFRLSKYMRSDHQFENGKMTSILFGSKTYVSCIREKKPKINK